MTRAAESAAPGRRAVEEATIDVGGISTFIRRRGGEGVPTIFVHGNPTHSEDWVPFLERIEGPAIALDLPGFGLSSRPPVGAFDYSVHAYGEFFARWLEATGVGRHSLVVHDWGAIALLAEIRRGDALARVVVIDAVPLLPGYRWHPVARIWRRRGLGELFNSLSSRTAMAFLLRQARGDRSPMPPGFVEMIWRHWDRGTRDAVLRLYRSADPGLLEAAGMRLDLLACPALVVWGGRDPYIPARFGRAYADRLGAELVEVDDAGHWPWHERPEILDRVLGFLASG